MPVRRMLDLNLTGQRVLIREDLNVPVEGGVITSDARIRASLPTIRAARDAGARVMLLSQRMAMTNIKNKKNKQKEGNRIRITKE